MKKAIPFIISVCLGFLLIQPTFAGVWDDPVLTGLDYATIAGYGTQDFRVVVARTIKAVLGFLGLVAIIIVVWGGFRWMTAGGNEENVKTAKAILIAGAIGLAIIILAYAIASFVTYTLADATIQS